MTRVLLFLMACLASSLCVQLECGPLEKLKVRYMWAMAFGKDAYHREQFGREVFDYFFDHIPDARNLFTRVRGDNLYSSEFAAHMMRVLGGLDMTLSLLTDEEILEAQLNHLFQKHKIRGIPNEYFKVFEDALDNAIPRHMDSFDQDAWNGCYRKIVRGMTKA